MCLWHALPLQTFTEVFFYLSLIIIERGDSQLLFVSMKKLGLATREPIGKRLRSYVLQHKPRKLFV